MPVPTGKNALAIRLTEPVVFVRGGDHPNRHRRQHPQDADESPAAMVRGLLTLDVAKPLRVSSIELELVGTSTTSWPEGMGARRIEVNEEHKIFTATAVFFKAGDLSASTSRRTMSVGPGLTLTPYYDHSPEDSEDGGEPRRGRTSRRNSLDRGYFSRQHLSYTEEHGELPPTPPYSPGPSYSPTVESGAVSPAWPRSPSASARALTSPGRASGFGQGRQRVEEDPSEVLAHSRNALLDHLEQQQLGSPVQPRHRSTTPLPGSSSSSYRESPSRRISFDDELQRPAIPFASVSNRLISPSPSARRPPHSPAIEEREHDERGRKKSRFSLSGMFEAVAERVRSGSRQTADLSSASAAGPSRDRTLERSRDALREISEERGRPSRERQAEGVIKRLKLGSGKESEEGNHKEAGDGWKEFKKGTYTYPISFALPADVPASLHCTYGDVIWRLRATVHRPGAFTQRMTAIREVTIVAAPGEDDTEDAEAVLVERQWEDQLQYLITVSGKSFYIGGNIPVHITMMPLAKIKVYRISVFLEEKVEYLTQFKSVARVDGPRRIVLFQVKADNDEPILPLISDSPDAFASSPLVRLLDPSEEDDSASRDELASACMGPGPWSFERNIQLPRSCASLHFTNKNKRSNMNVTHMLKVVFRVARGDDQVMDGKTGKRKQFDIVIQTPVTILSCLCAPEMTLLPRYSEVFHGGALSTSDDSELRCSCDEPRPRLQRTSTRGSISANAADNARSFFHGVGAVTAERSGRRLSDDAVPTVDRNSSAATAAAARRAPSAPASSGRRVSMPALARSSSLYAHTEQYERLVAGVENPAGEVPPSYEAVARA